jgi:hypothetical protein
MWKRYKQTRYFVSDDGKVYNEITGVEISISRSDRYDKVKLQLNNKTYTKAVHRMVAETFLESPLERKEVNHIDGNKRNNNVNNLEWVSHLENMQHAARNNLMSSGYAHKSAKLSEKDVEEIRILFSEGVCDDEIVKKFGIGPGTVAKIRYRQTWKNILPNLEYPEKSTSVHCASKKLCGEDIPKIRKLHEEGIRNRQIGEQFGVASATISNILLGKTWKNY